MNKLSKKSDTIEIRLSHELKTEFMGRCREQDRSASEVIRSMLEQRLAPAAVQRCAVPRWRIAAAALAGAALGLGAAAPSLARSADNTHAAFERLDRNHDGVVSYDEFHSR